MNMKSLPKFVTAAAVSLFALSAIAPQAEAAKIRLEGSGYYDLGTRIYFYPKGKQQGGRYSNLGRGYYHKTVIGMDWITNYSKVKTGMLSFEFWAMPYYGATKGIVLLTRGVNPLKAGNYYRNLSRQGSGLFLDRYRFPEINIWERTRAGWKFRDALSFRSRDLL